MKQITDERVEEIAAEQARNVMMPHNAASVDHNQRSIAHAIRQALTKERILIRKETTDATNTEVVASTPPTKST